MRPPRSPSKLPPCHNHVNENQQSVGSGGIRTAASPMRLPDLVSLLQRFSKPVGVDDKKKGFEGSSERIDKRRVQDFALELFFSHAFLSRAFQRRTLGGIPYFWMDNSYVLQRLSNRFQFFEVFVKWNNDLGTRGMGHKKAIHHIDIRFLVFHQCFEDLRFARVNNPWKIQNTA